MPSASAKPAEAESSGFVTCCGELTGTITLVPLSRPACIETIGGRSRARWGDSAHAHSFRGLSEAFRCGRSRERRAAGRETPDVG